MFNWPVEDIIPDVEGTKSNISKATDQLKDNSALQPVGIPAVFFKKAEQTKVKLMMLASRPGLNNSSRAEVHKMAHGSPAHEGRRPQLLSK